MSKLNELIDEQTSPLFRIMSAYNFGKAESYLSNNISCFHISNGYFLCVCHNLKPQEIPRKIDETIFQKELIAKVGQVEKDLLNKHYILNPTDNHRRLGQIPTDNAELAKLSSALLLILQKIKFDCSYETSYVNGDAVPLLVINFRDNSFYNDKKILSKFKSHETGFEAHINRYTFVLELEIAKAFYKDDICVYKLKTTDKEILNKIPYLKTDFTFYDNLSEIDLFCLQSSPSSELGRMLNTAHIDGIADHLTIFPDVVNSNYTVEGKRYITKNYFRFGSSGAPYIIYNKEKDELFFNALQSEACPIQMQISNDRNGHQQYTHAIATPLSNIKEYLEKLIG
jgi:hypothetical protein